MLARIEARHYDKILVRGLRAPNFWYDHAMWDVPSGVRAALLAHYEEAGTIPRARDADRTAVTTDLFDDVTILVPKQPTAPGTAR
jgi:hypothetical protein